MRLSVPTLALLLCAFNNLSYADEPLSRHGAVSKDQTQVAIEGGLTVTFQHSDESQSANELLGSFDLVSTLPAGSGEVVVYVEGSSSPGQTGVATSFEEANGDAGSALDRDGGGRFQVSEFHYSHPFGENSLALGLLNPAASLDASGVANDETAQFLGTSFVNNPTIGMPDYTLGVVYHYETVQTRPGFTLMATSSHGLGDNPNLSYSELVDINAKGKGAFLAAEVYGELGLASWRAGAWSNSAEHDYLDGSAITGGNTGLYLSTDIDLDAYLEQSKLNLRIGMADEKVSSAAEFYAVSLETPLASYTLGMGLARTGVSSKAGNDTADMRQAEVYVRLDMSDTFHVTPSVQWIENSGLIKDEENDQAIITSIRAGYSF